MTCSGFWDEARRAAASVTDAECWRRDLARAVHRATQARFVVVTTCLPNDPFSLRHSFVEAPAFAPLVDAIATVYLPRIEHGPGAMARRTCAEVYAPLLDTQTAALAAAMRQELLAPAGVGGMLNVFLGDPHEGTLGWLAVGTTVSCSEARRSLREPLRAVATEASRTLAGALALGRAFGQLGRAPSLPALTPREREVASLVADGFSDANVAARLRLSEETVGSHLRRIFRKLGVHSRSEMSARIRSGPHGGT